MSGNWVGLDEVMRELAAMTARAQVEAKNAVAGAAALVEKRAKRNFQGYHRKGEPHRGGPGSYPNVVSGTLRRSIITLPITSVGLGKYATTVGPTAKYGRRVELEYGYAFFDPAREQSLPAIESWSVSCWNRVRG